MSAYVQVALPVPLFKTFTYAVPEEWADRDLVGMRVSVPFGRRTMTGVIVEERESTELDRVRDIAAMADGSLELPDLLRSLLIGGGDRIERVGDLSRNSSVIAREPHRKVASEHGLKRFEQIRSIETRMSPVDIDRARVRAFFRRKRKRVFDRQELRLFSACPRHGFTRAVQKSSD